MAARYQHRERVVEAVAGHLINHPLEQLSLNGIAEACGVSLWSLRYNFENIEDMFRAVANRLIDQVLVAACYEEPPSAVVVDTIASYAHFVADLVRRPEYQDLLYLVIRNGRHCDWLRRDYERRIVARICGDLESLVRASGERHGMIVLFQAHAAQRFHRRIETELVLSDLLPSSADRMPVDVDRLLKEIVRETFEATYAFEWGSASAA